MSMLVELLEAMSYRFVDDTGTAFVFKKKIPMEVPNHVGAQVLTIRTKGKPIFSFKGSATPQVPSRLVTLAENSSANPVVIQEVLDHPQISRVKVSSQVAERIVSKYEVGSEDLTDKTILLALGGGIGDILFTTPIVRFLKEKFLTLAIDFATVDSYRFLLDKNPNVRSVLNQKEAKEIRDRYDKVLNLTGGIAANLKARDMHCVDALAAWVGITDPIKNKSLDLFPSRGSLVTGAKIIKEAGFEKGKDIIVGVNVAATARIRTWLKSHIRQLIMSLIKDPRVRVLLLGTTPDQEQFAGFPADRVVSLINATSLAQVIGIINYLSLLVAPDSGLLWVAQALKVKAIGLFGPFSSSIRVDPAGSVIPIDAEVACGPCMFHDSSECDFQNVQGESDCMRSIWPDRVFEAAMKALGI